MGNAISEMTLGGNMFEVATGIFDGKYNPGADGGQRISIPEFLGFTKDGWKAQNVGGRYGETYATSLPNAIWENMKANGLKSFFILGATPIATRSLRKVARPFSRRFNKAMRMFSIPLRF